MTLITPADLVGWASTAVPFATIGHQVYSQWKSKATAGVSRWLFVGQIGASILYRIHYLQLATPKPGFSFFKCRIDCHSDRRGAHLYFKPQATRPLVALRMIGRASAHFTPGAIKKISPCLTA